VSGLLLYYTNKVHKFDLLYLRKNLYYNYNLYSRMYCPSY